LANLAARLPELKKYQNKPLLVHCQLGGRSAKACGILRGAQFSQLHNLQGGLSAWLEAKLPVVKGSASLASKAPAKPKAVPKKASV
jgi:rhodanese-related sulfurtransferase